MKFKIDIVVKDGYRVEDLPNVPKGSEFYNKHPNGSICQYYKYVGSMLQYYTTFGEWSKSNNKEMTLFKIKF